MAAPDRRQQSAHAVGVGGTVVASTVGAGLGAAKLRDQYKEDYEPKFNRHVDSLTARARRMGQSPKRVAGLEHFVRTRKPRFPALVVAGAAGALATGAKRYESHRDHKSAVGKSARMSAFGVQH